LQKKKKRLLDNQDLILAELFYLTTTHLPNGFPFFFCICHTDSVSIGYAVVRPAESAGMAVLVARHIVENTKRVKSCQMNPKIVLRKHEIREEKAIVAAGRLAVTQPYSRHEHIFILPDFARPLRYSRHFIINLFTECHGNLPLWAFSIIKRLNTDGDK